MWDPQLRVTGCTIQRVHGCGRLLAFVSITLGNALAVHDIKIIQGKERTFVAMPSRPKGDGSFQDIVYPTTQEARLYLEAKILQAFDAPGDQGTEGAGIWAPLDPRPPELQAHHEWPSEPA